MGQNAGRRAPSFSDFFDGRQARAIATYLARARKLEQRRIPAKNAITPHLNAMGIAPKVVEGTLLQTLTLMFRTNASQIALQIRWGMLFEKQLCSNSVLYPCRLFSQLQRSAGMRHRCDQPNSSHSVLPPPPEHHQMFPLVPPTNIVSCRPPHSTLFSIASNPVNDSY